MDTQQHIQEAKSKIIWGEKPESVKQFLMQCEGINELQADGLIKTFISERNNHARGVAVQKIVTGSLLLLIPISYLCVGYFFLRVIHFKILAITLIPGVYGLLKLLEGIVLILKPNSRIEE
ncbi:hypothetical protein [Rubellicoccus peritrichatus]|uniref:Uncharacterized protein n=1 Tax=Rubellicoccus peritrichatus TaxID=3080537 RepID=A0AAQ3LCM1_9BACT|nr:hypothetical protein [Puniceicoccus sp. CR14]WOO43016.1 hypothetical protein RZN69_07915 [Puniceicoccus sp. CR14]